MKVFNLFTFIIESGKLFLIEGPIQETVFCPMFCLEKRIFKFRKVTSCVYPTMSGEFKNFIQIIRTSVIDKIVGYRFYGLLDPFTGR